MHLDQENQPKTENLTSQLNQHYNFRALNPKDKLPNNVDVILITGATDSIDTSAYSNLNEFLASGKKILLTQSGVNADIQTQQATPINSNIFDLLLAHRLKLNKNLVLDSKCGNVQVQQSVGLFRMNRAVQYPFFPVIDRFNNEDSTANIIVDNLEQVLPLFPSEIVIDTVENSIVSSVIPLFSTSDNSGLMESNFILSPDPQQNPFIKMLGQKGKIIAATSKLANGGELMLISDSRFLSDEGGMSIPDNIVFLMNTVDYLAGDKDLISLRSREISSRPLDILGLTDQEEASLSQEMKDKMKNKIKKRWKFINLAFPSFLIIGFGIFRFRKDKNQAEVLKQIYD